jgi:hypothetical protein
MDLEALITRKHLFVCMHVEAINASFYESGS